MSRIPRTAVAALLAGLALASSGAAAEASPTRGPMPAAAAFDVPDLAGPLRDTLIGPGARRAGPEAALASTRRYPVHDGRGRRVTIGVSAGCNPATCDSDNPRQIANFLGTLPHGSEITRLRIRLVTDVEMSAVCGSGALACYYVGRNRMFINGNDAAAPDGASRNFVLAHEYGHHVAQHRDNRPFLPTVDWGTKRWATYERVCQGVRGGLLVPGNQGSGYYRNPGEAFAESFALDRFPDSPVPWAWTRALRPDRGAFAAIRADTLHPWKHRVRSSRSGGLSAGGRQRAVERLRTPLDGVLSLHLRAPAGADFDLQLRDSAGRLIDASSRAGRAEAIDFLVCGQARMRAVVLRRSGGGEFRLSVRRP